jgi:hypothetical protein
VAERLRVKPWELDKVPASWYKRTLTAMNAEGEAKQILAERNNPKRNGAGE